MKVEILDYRYSLDEAAIRIELPDGRYGWIKIPVDRVLTRNRLVQAIRTTVIDFIIMDRRVGKLLRELHHQEIDIGELSGKMEDK